MATMMKKMAFLRSCGDWIILKSIKQDTKKHRTRWPPHVSHKLSSPGFPFVTSPTFATETVRYPSWISCEPCSPCVAPIRPRHLGWDAGVMLETIGPHWNNKINKAVYSLHSCIQYVYNMLFFSIWHMNKWFICTCIHMICLCFFIVEDDYIDMLRWLYLYDIYVYIYILFLNVCMNLHIYI